MDSEQTIGLQKHVFSKNVTEVLRFYFPLSDGGAF